MITYTPVFESYYDKFLEKALKGLSPSTVYQISPVATLFVAPDGTYVLLENQEAKVVSQDDFDTIIDDIENRGLYFVHGSKTFSVFLGEEILDIPIRQRLAFTALDALRTSGFFEKETAGTLYNDGEVACTRYGRFSNILTVGEQKLEVSDAQLFLIIDTFRGIALPE